MASFATLRNSRRDTTGNAEVVYIATRFQILGRLREVVNSFSQLSRSGKQHAPANGTRRHLQPLRVNAVRHDRRAQSLNAPIRHQVVADRFRWAHEKVATQKRG